MCFIACTLSVYCLLHTVFPPTIVHVIFVSLIFSAGILNKSSDSMTRSAYFPGVIDPRFCSTKFAYTINGAFANFVEQNRGSITPGKYADLVMLSDDLFKIQAAKIKHTNITWTMMGGQNVW